MKKIAVLFSGKGTNFAHIVNTLHGEGYRIVVALTNNPNAGGVEVAKAAGIPLEIVVSSEFESREAFDAEVVARLSPYEADLTVLAGFMRILTPVFTEKIRAINLHPSLLPRHKGLHAIQRSYEDEHDEGGVSVHWVSTELDGGEIILQKQIPKQGLDAASYERVIRTVEKEALVEAIEKVCST